MSKAAYTASAFNTVEETLVNGDIQPQNIKTGRVYVFGEDNNTQCTDDEVFEMGNIRARKANIEHEQKSEIQKINVIHRPVFPNDTLSKFALQYGCTVAELKTTNNLYNEQDFHALKHIKIPIQPHSLLTERAEEERRRENAFTKHESRTSEHSNNSDSDYENMNEDTNVRTVSIRASLKETEKFLQRMDDDIQKICQSVSSREADLSDVTRKLTTQCIHPRQVKKDTDELGVIWSGFGWKSALAAFIFISIIVPILYFIYIEKFKSE